MGAKQSAANRRLQLKNEKSPFKSALEKNDTTPFTGMPKPSREDAMEKTAKAYDGGLTKKSDRKQEKTQRSSSFRRKCRKVLRPIGNSSMSLKLGMPLDCPCPTFGELRQPPEAHPKRARHVEIGSTRAEKPRKREKFKRKSREINKKPEQEKTQASKEKEEKKPTTSEKKDKDTSCYLQLFPGTEKTGKDNDSTSYPILETACEEHAFITELVNKPPPKIDNFFELANPFENECDMLDVSDTIFDIANEFPNICLPSKELTPDIEAFNLEKPKKEKAANDTLCEQPTMLTSLKVKRQSVK